MSTSNGQQLVLEQLVLEQLGRGAEFADGEHRGRLTAASPRNQLRDPCGGPASEAMVGRLEMLMRRYLMFCLLTACTGPGESKPEPDTTDSTPPTEGPRVDLDGDGYTADEGDCDDNSAAASPGLDEACNGRDDNCDGSVDEGAGDADADGVADCLDVEECDGVDNDGDGVADEGSPDSDLDQLPDCLDVEECDRRDNDGDGDVDEGFDADGDGYLACGTAPDCDDVNPAVHPGVADPDDLVDNDCDGAIDEESWVQGEVMIAELMINPDAVSEAVGEWIEIVNVSDRDLVLNGLVFDTVDGAGMLVSDELIELRRYGTMVVGDSIDPLSNGGVDVEYAWTELEIDNSGAGSVSLLMGDVMVDYVSWDSSDASSYVGRARQLDPDYYDVTSNDGVYGWCAAEDPWTGSAGDAGSPGTPNGLCASIDHDGDGYTGTRDCDDYDASVSPAAVEVWYDGVDSDCDGRSDFDQDLDGYDDASGGGDDCDDTNSSVSPRMRELCDAADVDEDCDGLVDGDDPSASGLVNVYVDADGDGYGATASGTRVCDADAGYSTASGDCDDADASVSPAVEETWYDGLDADCDGASDYDADVDGHDDEANGGDDCDDADPAVNPSEIEVCDAASLDEDCNGLANEDDTSATLELWYADADGDGYGGGDAISACTPPEGYGTGDEDCDDADPTVYPDAPGESWYDGLDTDCDGANDYDQDADGYEDATGAGDDCDDLDPDMHPYAWEDTTDGIDNDCDGAADGADLDTVNLLALSDDDYETVSLAALSLPFCGSSYTSMHISSNGLVNFDRGNTSYSPTSRDMASWIGVAVMWDDLYPPGGGEVAWIEYSDAVGVYWRDVPPCCGSGTGSTFSIVFHEDGRFDMDYPSTYTDSAAVGWSCGTGAVAAEVDISSLATNLPTGAVGVDQGTEDLFHEIISATPRTTEIDLQGLTVPYCGQNGTDADGDGWTDSCGDTDDSDASVYPR